ncbi:MAG: alpha/beta hydrolase [Myxococcota bacterium]
MAHVKRTLDSDQERAHHRLRARIAGFGESPFSPPKSCHVILNGQRFHYLDWGDPEGDPVIFLHGGAQTARTWDAVCHAVCADSTRRAIALDQRGHGDSEWSYSFDYGPEAHARDLLALADHIGLDRFSLVGMSMGCINGLRFALDYPNHVQSFVAVDAGPWLNAEGAQSIADFVGGSKELASVSDYVARALAFNPKKHPELLEHSLRHNLRELPNGRWTWKTDWRRPGEFLEGVKQAVVSLQDEVHRLGCPLLVVRGGQSDIFRDEHAERFASAVRSGQWCTIPGAGHGVQGDQPRALVEKLVEFWGALG